MFKPWKWEIINCALAIGMLGSMLGILRRYDDQRIPDWGTAINLNTLIALMATLLRAMLVFVVAEIIGQAKWKYFAGGGRFAEDAPLRRLIETGRFNDASQGALGAVKLIPIITMDPATLLAVMVMFISLGTGSFMQQAIQTQSCQFPVDSAHASLPISRNITAFTDIISGEFRRFDLSKLVGALSSALIPDSEEIGSPISMECPTGNCTFQNPIGNVYSTLGVCSSCADTSSLIKSTEWASTRKLCDPGGLCGMFMLEWASTTELCDPGGVCESFTTNSTLPNGMSAQTLTGNINSTHIQDTELLVLSEPGLDWAGDLAGPDMKALSQWSFANVTVLAPNHFLTSSGYTDYVAATCTLYPCLRSYTGSVTSGKLDEVLVSTDPVVPNVAAEFEPNITTKAIQEALFGSDRHEYIYNPNVQFQAIQSPCLVNGTVWTKENKSSTLDMQRLFLVHADVDAGGDSPFRVEDTTAPAECIYSLEAVTVTQLSLAIDLSFNGSCEISGMRNDTVTIDCGNVFWLASFLPDNGTTAASIIKQFEAFADRLSNKMRMGFLNSPEAVSGQVLQVTVCSRIHYSWLTFPAVLVAVTSGLLAWTMLRSRCGGREMVWKSSILPFLFYGERFIVQNGEDMSGHSAKPSRRDVPKEPLLDLDQMEAEAKQRAVRFDVFD